MNFMLDNYGTDVRLDRRQKKTRLAVETALLELLKDKPLESISIRELAEKADINRKTFYNNYTCIEDVVHEIDAKAIDYIFSILPDKITINNEIEIYHLLVNFSESIYPHKELLSQVARNRSSMVIIEQLKEQILPYIEKSLRSYNINAAVIPYINAYVVNGLSCIYYEWLYDDNLSPQQVAMLAYNLTVSAIRLDNYRDIVSPGA